jgi:hypothetical protein
VVLFKPWRRCVHSGHRLRHRAEERGFESRQGVIINVGIYTLQCCSL